MKYGLPYKGSKNRLATRIVELLPKKKHLVDLFCGGCAVTHAAMMTDKYEHIIINDLNPMCPTFFLDVLAGKYKDERRWISREEFHRLKATDPYVAFVWSFGNNLRDYLYGEKIEPLKRAMHYAIFFHDYEPARELGLDLAFIEPIVGERERYLAVKHYMQEHPDAFFAPTHHFQQQSCERDIRLREEINAHIQGDYETSEPRSSKQSEQYRGGGTSGIPNLQHYTATCILEQMYSTRTPSCVTEPNVGGGKISSHTDDYRNVSIPQDSVVYCDIPYQDTNRYQKSGFDHEAFYEWCSLQTEPVFISSYEMPEDKFVCVAEFSHRSTLSASANNAVKERVFIPVHQAH